MRDTYNCFDVQVSTTQGEGFGLTTLEGMACGVPQIVPDWAALGDWGKRGAWMVPCTTTVVGSPYVNVIGGVPDEKMFITALQKLYIDTRARKNNAQAALECAQQPCFQWSDVGDAWVRTLDGLLQPVHEAEPEGLEKAADRKESLSHGSLGLSSGALEAPDDAPGVNSGLTLPGLTLTRGGKA